MKSFKIPEQHTQSYWAGCILAMLDRYYPDYNFSFVEAVTHYHALKELVGPTTWAILKTRRKFQDLITNYEETAYQPYKPRCVIGGYQEFIIGYNTVYANSSLRRIRNKERSQYSIGK
jgi:hypothetical protein